MTPVTRKPGNSQRWTYERAKPTPGKVCKDCAAEFGPGINGRVRTPARPAPYPGPRCASHHKAVQRSRRLAAAGRRVQSVYGITEEQYQALYESQGRCCAICQRAKGTSKRLAVDHDHACCVGPKSCGKCVRGLVCGPCNDVLAHLRDDARAFQRGVNYLNEWPSELAGITAGRSGIRRAGGRV